MKCNADLLEVAQALRFAGPHFAFRNSRQEKGSKNRDDRHDHQEFDQGEPQGPQTASQMFHTLGLANACFSFSSIGAVTVL